MVQLSPTLTLEPIRFKNFYGLGERADISHVALAAFIQEMDWSKIAILGEMLPYYDQMEDVFIPILERNNVTISWYGKVSYMSEDAGEMEKTVAEMKSRDPRIILIDGDSAASIACWLHKYGMYGPKYVIFFFYWAPIEAGGAVPDYVSSWCTGRMLSDVIKSSIFLGDTTKIEAFGFDTFIDSNGINGNEYMADLSARIINPDESPFWGFYPTYCYDMTLYVGSLVEQILHGFENGTAESMLKLIETKIYQMELVQGLKGDYGFQASTKQNSRGYTPITFSQVDVGPNFDEMNWRVVALYKSNDKTPLNVDVKSLKWPNGRAPRDSDRVIKLEQSLVSKVLYILLSIVAAVEIIALTAFTILALSKYKPQFFFDYDDYFLVIGSYLMLFQVFALPFERSPTSITTNCYAISTLIFVGFSMATFGMLIKVKKANVSYSHNYRQNFGQIKGPYVVIFGIVWIIFTLSFFIGTLNINPIAIETYHGQDYQDKMDSSIIYKPFIRFCNIKVETAGQIAMIIITCLLNFLALIYSSSASYSSQLKAKVEIFKLLF